MVRGGARSESAKVEIRTLAASGVVVSVVSGVAVVVGMIMDEELGEGGGGGIYILQLHPAARLFPAALPAFFVGGVPISPHRLVGYARTRERHFSFSAGVFTGLFNR